LRGLCRSHFNEDVENWANDSRGRSDASSYQLRPRHDPQGEPRLLHRNSNHPPESTLPPAIVNLAVGKIEQFRREVLFGQAGDSALLLGFGEETFSLRTSFHIQALIAKHTAFPSPEILELSPGVHLLHVKYNPTVTQSVVISLLNVLEISLGPELPTTLPSRTIYLPIVFDHASSVAAVER